MLKRRTTPLSWRTTRSTRRLTLKLTSHEKRFLRSIYYLKAFPWAVGPFAAKQLANRIENFVNDNEYIDKRKHLERCKAWSLIPLENYALRELVELVEKLRSCQHCDQAFTVVMK
jgi:hypothetical protein